VKAPEVKALVDTLTARVETHISALNELNAEHKRTVQTLNDIRREQEKEIALLKQRVDDMRLTTEKWVMRVWALVGPVSGVLLAYYLGIKK
jgi:hypothetical protein